MAINSRPSETTDWRERITRDPSVLGGRPVIRRLPIAVAQVLALLARGVSADELLRAQPQLEWADVAACLAYATEAVVQTPPAPGARIAPPPPRDAAFLDLATLPAPAELDALVEPPESIPLAELVEEDSIPVAELVEEDSIPVAELVVDSFPEFRTPKQAGQPCSGRMK